MSAHTDTLLDTERLPHDPNLPKGDILIDIFGRITDMSDALHDPDGLLQTRLRDQDNKTTQRHQAVMNVLGKILNEVLEVKARLDLVEETVETQGAKFTLMNGATHPEIQ